MRADFRIHYEIRIDFSLFSMVVVAQLVEHRFVVPAVVGSSPIDHPKR